MAELKPRHFLNRFGSGLIYGILGFTITGVATSLGFIPAIINGATTSAAVGSVLFIAEVVRGAIEKSDSDAEKADAK